MRNLSSIEAVAVACKPRTDPMLPLHWSRNSLLLRSDCVRIKLVYLLLLTVQYNKQNKIILCTFLWTRELGYRSRYSYSLRAGRSGDRVSVGARFSATVQTGYETHPASYTMGTGSFPEVKQPSRCLNRPLQSNAEVKDRVGLYLYSTSGPSWPVLGWNFPLFLPLYKPSGIKCLELALCYNPHIANDVLEIGVATSSV
jgi:hypothetical protein